MYSSKPIIYAIDSGDNIIDKYKCGISIEAENSNEIKSAILKLYNIKRE